MQHKHFLRIIISYFGDLISFIWGTRDEKGEVGRRSCVILIDAALVAAFNRLQISIISMDSKSQVLVDLIHDSNNVVIQCDDI